MIQQEWFDITAVEHDPTFVLTEASDMHTVYANPNSHVEGFADNILLREVSFEAELITQRLLDLYASGAQSIGQWEQFTTSQFQINDNEAIGIMVHGICKPNMYEGSLRVNSTSLGVFATRGDTLRLTEAIVTTATVANSHTETLKKIALREHSLRELVQITQDQTPGSAN